MSYTLGMVDEALTLGERYDEVGDRMDAAYAALRGLTHGTPEHVAATATLEAVYTDLRALNAEVKAR